MKSIKDITSNIQFKVNDNTAEEEKTAEIVNKLFLTMQAIFPAFQKAWPTEKEFEMAKVQWVKAFIESNLKDIEDIKRGIANYRKLATPFVPSPGQFIQMCKKERKHPSHQEYIAPIGNPSSKEQALSHLQKLMQILK